MIGKPKYKLDDIVTFDIEHDNRKIKCVGRIDVVDAYGTFEQNEEVSYDIMVDNWDNTDEPMFVKHIVEPNLRLL